MARDITRERGDGRGGEVLAGQNFLKLYSFDVPDHYPKTKTTEQQQNKQQQKIKPQIS